MIGFLNHWGEVWVQHFLPLLTQNTVFLGLVFLLLHLLRRTPAKVRSAVALVALAKLLLPPFLPLSLPIDRIEFLPLMQGGTETNPVVAAGEPLQAFASSASSVELAGLVLVVWLGAAALYLAYSLVASIMLANRLRSASPISPAEAASYLDAERYSICPTDRISVPLTLGLRPRRIFVPASWNLWPDECRRMVIAHELAHIKRRDGLTMLVQILATALYLFHPLVMLLVRRLKEYREMACDDMSVMGDRRISVRYSRYLVEIAESLIHPPLGCESASALMMRSNELLNRVEYQMKGADMRPLSRKSIAGVVIGMLMLITSLSWYGSSSAGDSDSDVRSEKETVELSIKSNRHLEVDGEQMSMVDLNKALTWLADKEGRESIITIECKSGNVMGTVLAVQGILQENNFLRIEYSGKDGSKRALTLPASDQRKKLASMKSKNVATLLLDNRGSTYLDGEHVYVRHLGKAIRKRLQENSNLIISLEVEEEVPYGDFLGVLDQIDEAAAKRLHVAQAE